MSRFGCNGSACHGKAEGQNGFKLSVFGNDPASDYEALVVSGRGRRVMPAAPEQRLLLLKSAAAIPHTGGPRMRVDSEEYRLLHAWIAGITWRGSWKYMGANSKFFIQTPRTLVFQFIPRIPIPTRTVFSEERMWDVCIGHTRASHRDWL